MEQAYFSNIRSKIIPYLKQSNEEIVIAMAWFTSGELFYELLECLKRNVRVELVLLDNATNFMYYAPDFNLLIKAGGKLRIARVEDGFMHHKFCVIDNRIAITGSYNWTYYAETRNIENIIITDNAEIVRSYKKEFTSLVAQTHISTECPRLDWSELETCQHVNMDELNFEIENIAKVQHLPVRKIVKVSAPLIEIIDTPLNPISKYDIGILLDDGWKKLIMEGESLPKTKVFNFKNHEDERESMRFILMCWNNDPDQDCILFDRPISDLTAGVTDWRMNIKIQITLDSNGYLHVSITCVETGRTLNLQDTNSKYVTYES
ncbi:MAG: DUF1669 domain-containing protein [Bacteroidaceae bacterium]|nr:DUF1669 domain-containing protein [Bacteroidaceae bacterium]